MMALCSETPENQVHFQFPCRHLLFCLPAAEATDYTFLSEGAAQLMSKPLRPFNESLLCKSIRSRTRHTAERISQHN